MWSRIISWILAAITSLMNGFGMYTQEYKPFSEQAEYTIQEEAVDYMQLRSWYISSYGGSGTCVIERKPGEGELNKMGFFWIVRGGSHNPDAKIEFESGTVIVAPNSGKITNSPNSSGNKIIFANDEKNTNACRMEIINPERWYCCLDAEPTSSGMYVHSNGDHRLELSQGDAICVAGPETTMKLYRGNNEGVLAECKTLREFLLYTDAEGGDPNLNISAGGDLKPGTSTEANGEGTNITADKVPGVDSANIYTGGGEWHTWQNDTSKWWYGTDTEWAADQYAFVDGNWYYFDSDGEMLTGWCRDNHYYLTSEYAQSGHPEGSMALNTIVPQNGYPDRFVHVSGTTGFDDTEEAAGAMQAHGKTYSKVGNYYVVTATGDGNSSVGSNGGSANSGGGSDSSTQGGTISEDEWNSILSGEQTTRNGWISYNGAQTYVENGYVVTNADSDWRYGEYRCYKCNDSQGGHWYLFDDDGTLVTLQRPFEFSGYNAEQHWVYNTEKWGLAQNEQVVYEGETLYADGSCYLREGSSSGPLWNY